MERMHPQTGVMRRWMSPVTDTNSLQWIDLFEGFRDVPFGGQYENVLFAPVGQQHGPLVFLWAKQDALKDLNLTATVTETGTKTLNFTFTILVFCVFYDMYMLL